MSKTIAAEHDLMNRLRVVSRTRPAERALR